MLDKRLQSIDLAVVLSLHKLDLSESTLANDLQCGEVLRPFLSPQETEVFCLLSTHKNFPPGLAGVRNGGVLHNRFQLEGSELPLARTEGPRQCNVPLVAVPRPLHAILEEGAN